MIFVFKSTGLYLGFIFNGFLFSRDGVYLGWVDGNFVWDPSGRFRGQLVETVPKRADAKYIIFNRFGVQPVPKSARQAPLTPALPSPPANIAAVSLPTGWVDAF